MWIDGELPFAIDHPFIPIAAEDEGANVLCSHDSDVGKATQARSIAITMGTVLKNISCMDRHFRPSVLLI